MDCPCGSELEYKNCCGAIIKKERIAETAEELMRSRYTAFTAANVDYLLNSNHQSTRPNKQRKAIKKWAQSIEWIGLTIINKIDGEIDNNEGYVEFRAVYIENDKYEQIHENSYFVKENNKWFYVGGTDIETLNKEKFFL